MSETPSTETSEDTAETFGHYDLLEVIGKGATGTVYRARHRVLEREVALKVFKPSRASEGWQLRLMREARAAAKLEHPNIVRIYEATEIEGTPCLAFELVRGRTLRELLESEGSFEPTAALALIEKISRGVHHAHELGIVHRDLKPANVLVDASGEPRIVDFGVAKDLNDPRAQLSESGTLVGTPAYLAPEQAEGRVHDVDRRADVWALGLLLYELVTGKNPFRNDNVFKLLDTIRFTEPPPPLRPDGRSSGRSGEIALWALRKKREDRPPTALALALACHEALATADTLATAPPPPPRRRMRPALIVALNALAILVLLAGITVQLRKHEASQPLESPSPVSSSSTPVVSNLTTPAPLATGGPDTASLATAVRTFLASYPPTRLARPTGGAGDTRGRLEHDGRAIALSPDGQHIVAGGIQGEVTLFDALSGKLVAVHARGGVISTIAYSDDGTLIAVGRNDGSVELEDAFSLAPLAPSVERVDRRSPLPKAKAGIDAQPQRVIVPDEGVGKTTLSWLSSSTKPASVRLTAPGGIEYELASGLSGTRDLNVGLGVYKVRLTEPGKPDQTTEVHGVPQFALPNEYPATRVSKIAFSPDGRLVAASFDNGAPAVWDRTDAKRLDLQATRIKAVAFTDDRKLLAGASDDGTITLWDPTTGIASGRTATIGVGAIHDIVRTPRGLVVGGAQGVALFSVAERKTRWIHANSGAGAGTSVAVLERGPVLDAHATGTAHVLDPETGKARHDLKLPSRPHGIAISSDGKRAWAAVLATVSLWDPETGQREWPQGADDGLVTGLGETRDGGLFIARRDGSLELQDLGSGRRLGGIQGRTTHDACLSRNGGAALVSFQPKALVAIDLTTWTESARSDVPNEATLLAPTSQGSCYFVDIRGSLGIWPITSGAFVLASENEAAASKGGAVTGVASAHEKKVTAWCTHDAVFVRDAALKPEVLPDLAPRPPLHSVAVSRSGDLVLVGRLNGAMELFDRRVRTWRKLDGSVGRNGAPLMAFTLDERLVVSATIWDRGVRVWSVATAKEVDRFPLPFDTPSRIMATGASAVLVGTRRGLALKLELDSR